MKKEIWMAAIVAGAIATGVPGKCAAETTSLASATNYYYTVPESTNIVGLVMGERGDYRLMRYEDVAWINEGWAERIALAENRVPTHDGWGREQTAFKSTALIEGGRNGEVESTRAYWTNATPRTTAVSTDTWIENIGSQETVERIMESACGGAAGSGERRIVPPKRKGHLNMEAVTNAYKVLKDMKVVVRRIDARGTNWTQVVEEHERAECDGETTYQMDYTKTNVVEDGRWYIQGGGKKLHSLEVSYDLWDEVWSKEYVTDWLYTKGDNVLGKMRLELQFGVRSTNDWLRGEETPKVVKAIRAYGVVYVEEDRDEMMWKRRFWWDESAHGWEVIATNEVSTVRRATVLVELGEATWRGVRANSRWEDGSIGSGQCLAYEVEVDLEEMMDECAKAVPGMAKVEEVKNANQVPELILGEWDEGKIDIGLYLECEIKKVYLVIELQPVTSLPGW